MPKSNKRNANDADLSSEQLAEQKAKKAAYDKKRRDNETAEQKKSRLEADAARQKGKRAQETDIQRQARLEAEASRQRITRAQETDIQRKARLEAEATRQNYTRAQETDIQRKARLEAEASRQRITRAQETDIQKKARLEADATRKNYTPAQETDIQRKTRLEVEATRQNYTRAQETDIQRKARLETNAARAKERRSANAAKTDSRTTLKAIAESAYENEASIEPYYCGKMDAICAGCNAKHFTDEPFHSKNHKQANGDVVRSKTYTKCCKNGQIKIEEEDYPELFQSLMRKEDNLGVNFMNNIRSINSSFAFASMGANIKPPPGYGPWCFRIHGQIYHRTGTLHPPAGEKPQYAQLYILDAEEANKERSKHPANKKVNDSVFITIADFLDKNNKFVASYKMLHEVEKESIKEAERNGGEINQVTMAIVNDRKKDKNRYNLQAANEVAVVFQNKDGLPPLDRDLLIHARHAPNDPNKGMKTINILHKNLEAMVYPLLFPYGEQGYGLDITKNSTGQRNKVTMMEYYSYRLYQRDRFNQLLNAGRLTQQYIVDAYVKMEADRLNFIRNNQKEFRGDTVKGLQDYVASENDAEGKKPETVVLLPSSFQGGPRQMQQSYLDAMSIVTKFGKPDLFVTVTCNPKWMEIQENLEPWQCVEHIPDLVAKVFKLKLDKLMSEVVGDKGGIFGKVVAWVYVIEFQKRGLPHAHILLILDAASKLTTEQKIDAVIKAEIPDKETNPILFDIVTSHMVHGPCGKGIKCPCMKNDTCSKKFPKEYQERTLGNHEVADGFAKYQRRRGTEVVVKDKVIDNRWIVPYNPYLLLRYNCHINVEACSSVNCVKYIFKYIHKGHDCASIEVKESTSRDEVTKHVDSRYVSAPESMWRILGYALHEQFHSVERLAVHLPGEQFVVLQCDKNTDNNDEVVKKALEKAGEKRSTLMGWFQLNNSDLDARKLYYYQIPESFTWLKSERRWKIRERYFNKLGRMYTVSPKDAERFYLRLLLLHVKGAISFEDLKTLDGVTYETFRESAKERGLLQDDNIWQNTLNDAIACQMPSQLRQIFAYICAFCAPSDPAKLWTDNLMDMTEDICHRLHQKSGDCIHCEDHALKDLKKTLLLLGLTLSSIGLREPQNGISEYDIDTYDPVIESAKAETLIRTLNIDQKSAFDAIIDAVNDDTLRSKCFFLDGPGGSGKTYLYETLLHYLRGEKYSVLAAATTGIAANLLEGGRTFHSLFKLGIPITEDTVSRISPSSNAADVIRQAILIIIDECTMVSSHAIDAIDRFLREVMECVGGKKIPFGGKIILLGGDFRQCLAIVPHAMRPAIVQGCLKYCDAWNEFKTLSLKNNMRSSEPAYSEWLLKLGDGELENSDGQGEEIIEVPPQVICTGSIVNEIFGTEISVENVKTMSKRAILCPKNDSVDKINDEILNLINTDESTYISTDKIEFDEKENGEITDFPDEFVNSLTPSGMPPHKLKLKIGCVIMLLRNLNTKEGLCNGKRLFVVGLQRNLITAEVLTGSSEGKQVLIPRIDLSPSDTALPFKLTRRQFPVKVAFAMTINKSQGQTLEKVGIVLHDPVFGHGQLYVAFSRVRRFEDLRVKVYNTPDQGRLLKDSDKVFTKNIVYKEIF